MGLEGLFSFQQQEVRDLAWVMNSPGLLAQTQFPYTGEKVSDAWCKQIYQYNLDWLVGLDDDPGLLQQWLEQRESPLLGIYFESLLAFWLQHLPDIDLLAQNLVVGQPGLQIGEFDLLFRDKARNQAIHWEAAVKFYLRYGESDYQWLGPNPRDSLSRKLNKVFARQLRLAEHARAKQVLLEGIGVSKVVPQAFIKGYLFYPFDSDWQNPIHIPAGVSEKHLKGWWCRHADVATLLQQRSSEKRWLVLPRLQWLSSVFTSSDEELLIAAELKEYLLQYFSKHYKALLLVELKFVDGAWQEQSRGFVVNDAWPE